MKKHQFLLVAIAFLFSLTTYAVNDQQSTNPCTSKIELEGKLKSKGGFRSGTDPIVAELQGNILFIRFQKDVGTLQVVITGPQGEVYSATVNTETPSAVTIPLAGLPAGKYTVSFSNERGVMWGEFFL